MAKQKSIATLNVWIQARRFRNMISNLTHKFPRDEKYRLTDQIIRSSRSISANIAEGYGRYHYQETSQFMRQARGSLIESFDHLTVSYDEKYIDKAVFDQCYAEYENLLRTINGYIYFLQKSKSKVPNT